MTADIIDFAATRAARQRNRKQRRRRPARSLFLDCRAVLIAMKEGTPQTVASRLVRYAEHYEPGERLSVILRLLEEMPAPAFWCALSRVGARIGLEGSPRHWQALAQLMARHAAAAPNKRRIAPEPPMSRDEIMMELLGYVPLPPASRLNWDELRAKVLAERQSTAPSE